MSLSGPSQGIFQKERSHNEERMEKPQMIVVMRGSSEENVLTICKWDNSSGPVIINDFCMMDYPSGCTTCDATMPS